MVDKQFTLVELHLHEPVSLSVGNSPAEENAPDPSGGEESETAPADASDASGATGAGKRVGEFLAMVVLVAAVAVAVRKLSGGDDELEALSDLDEDRA